MPFLESLEPQYREQWEKHQHAKLLKPEDTEEFIWSSVSVGPQPTKAQSQGAVASAQKESKCAISQQKDLLRVYSQAEVSSNQRQSIEERSIVVAMFRKTSGQMRLLDGTIQRSYREVKKDAAWRQTHLSRILQRIQLLLGERYEWAK